MLMTRVPDSSCTSTVSSRGVLDISSIFFLMNSFSVAFWKYFDLAILSTNFRILLPFRPPGALWRAEEDKGIEGEEGGDIRTRTGEEKRGWERRGCMRKGYMRTG